MTTSTKPCLPQKRVLLHVFKCHTDDCCPTLLLDTLAAEENMFIITDDWGNEVNSSKDLIETLLSTKFENIINLCEVQLKTNLAPRKPLMILTLDNLTSSRLTLLLDTLGPENKKFIIRDKLSKDINLSEDQLKNLLSTKFDDIVS